MREVTILKSRINQIGGLEKYTLKLCERFAHHGCIVTLLTTTKNEPLPKIEGTNIVTVSKSLKPTFYHLKVFDRACQEWLQQTPSPIVFGMERTSFQTHYRAGSGVHAIYLKRRAMTDSAFKQFCFSINPLHRTLLSLEKRCFEDSHLKTIFTNSHMVKNEIINSYDTDAKKIDVIYNGAPFKDWAIPFEKSLESDRKKFEFLFIGNGFRRKGLQFALQGLSYLKEKNFHLSVVGRDKELKHFRELSDRLGLKDKVTFWGEQKQTLSFYKQADALLIPSIYDPCANVTLEGLAMGLFIVTSRYNGGSELLNAQSGVVIDTLTDSQSMVEALKSAFDHPKTRDSAEFIRNSIKELDFSIQLDKIVKKTLS